MDLFSNEQLATLRAAIDRIIPPDDDPGGWEAGVGDYLQRQLTRGDLQAYITVYREGLSALDAEALAEFSQPFTALESTQQDEILTCIEQAAVSAIWPVNPALFLAMLTEHCAEGFYSDPNNGGNHQQVAWKMIGFEVRG